MAKTSICLYGSTSAGKTQLVGELAEFVYSALKKKSLVYMADGGGFKTIKSLVDLGVVDIEDLREIPLAFESLDAIAQGKRYDQKTHMWVKGTPELYGMIAFEGLTSIGDKIMRDMAVMDSKGVHIGADPSACFTQGSLTVPLNTRSQYGVGQATPKAAVALSQMLHVEYVVWTALDGHGSDVANEETPILGPSLPGSAINAKIPSWFEYTFRVVSLPQVPPKPCEHRLYLHSHIDPLTVGYEVERDKHGVVTKRVTVKALANDRVPEGVPPLPDFIAPASLVKALEMVEGKQAEALDMKRKKLNINSSTTHKGALSV